MRKRGQRRSKERSESETFVPEVQAPQQDTTQEPIKKIVTKVFLDEEKEEEILEWIKSNSTLYDKSLKEFKNKSDKDAKWNQKAEELGISGMKFFLVVSKLLFQQLDKIFAMKVF